MEGSLDDFLLVCSGQCVKPHCISGNTNRQARIFVRMIIGIEQKLPVEHVHVQMVRALSKIAGKQLDQRLLPALHILNQRIRCNAEGIGLSLIHI